MSKVDLLEKYGPAALVTGASSGIGEAYAKLLAAAGFDLLLVARRVDRLEQNATELGEKYGVNIQCLKADLADPLAIAAIDNAAQALDIGLLVNNAGFGLKGPHHLNDAVQLNEMLQVNCIAPMQLSYQIIPRLLSRGSGALLFTGSVEGIMGFPNSSAYAGSKAFVQNFAESLWGELEDKNIDVLVLEPGSTDTEALDKQGVDRSKLLGMMSAEAVAQIGLDNIANGPVMIAGEENAQIFTGLSQMPRRDALRMMAKTMADSLVD